MSKTYRHNSSVERINLKRKHKRVTTQKLQRALREQRRFEEALSGILAYGLDDMRRRPGEEA